MAILKYADWRSDDKWDGQLKAHFVDEGPADSNWTFHSGSLLGADLNAACRTGGDYTFPETGDVIPAAELAKAKLAAEL
ncbi:MAG: hypothetical protein KDI46_05855 [Alphaproteobacteria bacterium]|nr:hypothetical protein [Alphaproteobacteria bacterium]